MDLDAATKEAPTLTLDPFAEAKAEIVEKKPEELVEEPVSYTHLRACSGDGTDTGRTENGR